MPLRAEPEVAAAACAHCGLAVPARRYLQGHMDDVAEAVQYAYSQRNEIKGLKKVDKPGRSRFEPALFAAL